MNAFSGRVRLSSASKNLEACSRSRKHSRTRATAMATKIDTQAVEDAISWCHLHGLVVGQGDGIEDMSVIHAPFSLFPTPFPAEEFKRVQAMMPHLSTLVHVVSQDIDYLNSTLGTAAQFDSFTKSLMDIHSKTAEARGKHASPISLGLHRSDYMLDEPSGDLLQVELNTIASSFGSLSTLLSQLHSYLIPRYPDSTPATLEQLPDQDALYGFANGLAQTHQAFCSLHNLEISEATIVMVVQPGERNAFDQRWLQLKVWEVAGVKVIRKTLAEVAEQGEEDPSGHMRIEGKVASVFYFRAGYTPEDYRGATEWRGREAMESCSAISCPSVAYQLVGAKKIQQDLAAPGRLEQFVAGEEIATGLRSCFAGLWSLDDPSDPTTHAIMQSAISCPHDYVLKPQREGGGNNLYDEDLAAKLKEGGEDLASYILMQRIKPATNTSVLVRKGKHGTEETLSELGVYGVYLQVKDEVVINECVGHLLRTKTASSNEGGVAAGFAVLDSPYLA